MLYTTFDNNSTLRNISFKYSPTEKCILKNINLKINAGEKVAFDPRQ